MRTLTFLAFPLLMLAGACGSSHDRDSETVDEPLVVLQGDFIEGEARSDDTYPFLDWYRFEEDVDNLPPGFDYDTYDIFFDGLDRLWVEYDLSIAAWTTPGFYQFQVIYDFYDTNSIFREEVEFRFHVEVVESTGGHRVVLRGRRGLESGERAAGADTEVRIGEE